MKRLRRWARDMHYRSRHLESLLRQVLQSLRTRGVRETWRRAVDYLRHKRYTPEPPLRPFPESIGPAELVFAAPEVPRASVIVPAYNQLEYTLRCLKSLMDSGDATAFEVIVVDDASQDSTAAALSGVPGLRLHRNALNLGFIGACNAGAALARGEYLVFLNNDTVVRSGWLDALLSTFDSHPDTGLAGSKLVYPDNRLQEAGGLVFADGSAWNYGRFGDPADPRYSFVREVDYCSGAAIAIPRTLFGRLGGFDAYYAPAYYEDVDLAMRVRQAGYAVRYQPASTVVHFEGVTSGTDTSTGVKANQLRNQVNFLERWRDELARAHPPPELRNAVEDAAKHCAHRRVLVLDACTPTPDRDAGSVRMFHIMRLLREQGCAVSFFPENLAHDGPYTEALQRLGVETWWHPWIADVPRWLRKYGAHLDLIVASRHYVLSPLLPLLREHAPKARIVFDTVDLHFLREQREAEQIGDPSRRRVAAQTREAELRLVRDSDLTWVVSPHEQALLRNLVPGGRVEVLSTIHNNVSDTPDFAERRDLAFVGSYRHPPNVDAAHWLSDEIFPRIRAIDPDVRLHLIGGDASEAVAALGQRPGIVFHGHVSDLDALLDSVRLSLAPLRYGAGVKGKINHSLSRGLPVVATQCAVEGMHLRSGEDVLVADGAEAFAEAVLRLYRDEAQWQQLRIGGLDNTRRYFSPESARLTLRALLDSLPPKAGSASGVESAGTVAYVSASGDRR